MCQEASTNKKKKQSQSTLYAGWHLCVYVWLINVQFDIWRIDDNVMTIVIVDVITYNE